MTFQHIPFRTKGYGLRGVIKDQCQMGYALDGMVDRQYEKLTDIVQGNGLHHRWNDMKLASDDVLFHFLQFVKSNSRVWQGHSMSANTMMSIAYQIERDTRES